MNRRPDRSGVCVGEADGSQESHLTHEFHVDLTELVAVSAYFYLCFRIR